MAYKTSDLPQATAIAPQPHEEDEPNEVKQPCCDAWFKAHQDYTDNEGHGPLITDFDDGPETGCGSGEMELPPLKFCPWCGTKKD